MNMVREIVDQSVKLCALLCLIIGNMYGAASSQPAIAGYYDQSNYQKLINDNTERHMPVLMLFDETEPSSNPFVADLLDAAASLVADSILPITVLTTPHTLNLSLNNLIISTEKNISLFSIFTIKSLNLIALVPKAFEAEIIENFQPDALEKIVINNSSEFRYWLTDALRKSGPPMFDKTVFEQLFNKHEQIIWDFYISGHGRTDPIQVAGLRPEAMRDLLALLNEMRTGSVFIASCYLPGPNIDTLIPEKALMRFTMPFTYFLFVSGIYDAVIYGQVNKNKVVLTTYFEHAARIDKAKGLNRLLTSMEDVEANTPNIIQVLLPRHQTFMPAMKILKNVDRDKIAGSAYKGIGFESPTYENEVYISAAKQSLSILEKKPLVINSKFALFAPGPVTAELKIYGKPIPQTAHSHLFPNFFTYPLGIARQAFPKFVFLQEEQSHSITSQQNFSRINLSVLPSYRFKDGIIRFLIDAFARHEGSFSGNKMLQQYYIQCIVGPNDFFWELFHTKDAQALGNMKEAQEQLFTWEGDVLDFNDFVKVTNIQLNFYKKDPTTVTRSHETMPNHFITLDFDFYFFDEKHRYSFLIDKQQTLWTAREIQNNAIINEHELAEIKQTFIPHISGDMIAGLVLAKQIDFQSTLALIRDRNSKELASFLAGCIIRTIITFEDGLRLLQEANVDQLELMQHFLLPLAYANNLSILQHVRTVLYEQLKEPLNPESERTLFAIATRLIKKDIITVHDLLQLAKLHNVASQRLQSHVRNNRIVDDRYMSSLLKSAGF